MKMPVINIHSWKNPGNARVHWEPTSLHDMSFTTCDGQIPEPFDVFKLNRIRGFTLKARRTKQMLRNDPEFL